MAEILESLAKFLRKLTGRGRKISDGLPANQSSIASLTAGFSANDVSLDCLKAQAKSSLSSMDYAEIKFLELLVKGWSLHDISVALSCTVEEVERKSRDVMDKLQVVDATGLVRIGIYADLDSEG